MKFPIFTGLILGFAVSTAYSQRVVINEVMYAPIKPEPEWIELFNPSDSVISIKGWTISNHSHTYPLLLDTIAPGGFVVLTKDSVQFLRSKYAIPNANILQTTLPSLVNTGDDIVFKDSLGNIIDSIKYSPKWGGASGSSLERIDYAAPGDSSNFGNCIDTLGGTPAAPNSILRKDFDLAIESVSYRMQNQNDLSITVTIINKGRKQLGSGMVTIISNFGLPIAESQITSPIEPLQKQDIVLVWQNADNGKTNITAFLDESQDEVRSNDTLRAQLYIPVPRNAVVINEIMATPKSTSSQWIELYNNSEHIARIDSVSLFIGFIDTTYKFRIDSLTLLPKHYAVIDASVKFFSQFPGLKGLEGMVVLSKSDFNLQDSGAEVMIVNTDSSIIDSLHYQSSWHSEIVTNHTGISLEKKISDASSTDVANWASSLDPLGSTPLRQNSYASDTLAASAALDIQISPNPFSPDGDGFNDITNITISIPSDNVEVISAKLYDLRGRLRSTIAQNQRVFRTISFLFDGKDDNKITLPIGLYMLVIESANGLFKPQRNGIVIMKKAR